MSMRGGGLRGTGRDIPFVEEGQQCLYLRLGDTGQRDWGGVGEAIRVLSWGAGEHALENFGVPFEKEAMNAV